MAKKVATKQVEKKEKVTHKSKSSFFNYFIRREKNQS
jgi:hypothetical protein